MVNCCCMVFWLKLLTRKMFWIQFIHCSLEPQHTLVPFFAFQVWAYQKIQFMISLVLLRSFCKKLNGSSIPICVWRQSSDLEPWLKKTRSLQTIGQIRARRLKACIGLSEEACDRAISIHQNSLVQKMRARKVSITVTDYFWMLPRHCGSQGKIDNETFQRFQSMRTEILIEGFGNKKVRFLWHKNKSHAVAK